MSKAEQEKGAFERFQKLYEDTKNRDRAEAIPLIVDAYEGIIRDFPDAGLAQEAYLKLVMINLEDNNPPDTAAAEEYFRRMVERYPGSVLLNAAEGTIMGHYFHKKNWEPLLRFTAPLVRQHLESPKIGELFYYAEANRRLGRGDEARNAFQILIDRFPRTREAKLARERMALIGTADKPEDGSRRHGGNK